MMKQEFAELAGLDINKLSSEDYAKIEKVYLYHPYYGRMTKGTIARAYNQGGIGYIEALLKVSEQMEALDRAAWDSGARRLEAVSRMEAYERETEAIMAQRRAGLAELQVSVEVAEAAHTELVLKLDKAGDLELEKFMAWAKQAGFVVE